MAGCSNAQGSEPTRANASNEALAASVDQLESGAPAAVAAPAAPTLALSDPPPDLPWAQQRAYLYGEMKARMNLTDAQVARVKEIIDASPLLGLGRPDDTTHPLTRTQCRETHEKARFVAGDAQCGAPNMVAVYDPANEKKENAKLCIDQYEYPDIPCEYPVTYGSSMEAAELCSAVGKRICDAHEWEGACAGAVHPVSEEYHFEAPRPYATWLHNKEREITWAYGKTEDRNLCGEAFHKSEKCDSTGLTHCGSNTYPAGSFPGCVSPFGVYDQHGNAAEHMNLALKPEELASRGGTGQTEMKGSWFFQAMDKLYEDDCRWRAKDWHPSTLMTVGSHRNYHLGFRCCKDLP